MQIYTHPGNHQLPLSHKSRRSLSDEHQHYDVLNTNGIEQSMVIALKRPCEQCRLGALTGSMYVLN